MKIGIMVCFWFWNRNYIKSLKFLSTCRIRGEQWNSMISAGVCFWHYVNSLLFNFDDTFYSRLNRQVRIKRCYLHFLFFRESVIRPVVFADFLVMCLNTHQNGRFTVTSRQSTHYNSEKILKSMFYSLKDNRCKKNLKNADNTFLFSPDVIFT